MKKLIYIYMTLAALFLVTSCAMEEMSGLFGPEDGEEVVVTFRPRFEDFESVTKAIGDASQVDRLLVHVYESDTDNQPDEYAFDVVNTIVQGQVCIPFFYGKTYKVYFWAYNSHKPAYKVAETGIRDGITVNYPESTASLASDALEYLDAFYAVETVNLSDNITDNANPSLTRPFAQVNLIADKTQLSAAKASKVEFKISAADKFVLSASSATVATQRTFTFTSNDHFQTNLVPDTGNVYLGTTYLFVPSAGPLEATVTLYDSMGNRLKGPTKVSIGMDANKRTNLVFGKVEPAWDSEAAKNIPAAGDDGWIHIEKPEQLTALLTNGTSSEQKVHICNDIDMSGVPSDYHDAIASASFAGLTLYGGNMESGVPAGGNSAMIRNFTAPAFLGTATNLTVSNLTFENINITATDHVGTLVNTLKGTSTFTNVVVSNSSATTTNGAAGGIVGYVERIAPTTRSEILNVVFNNCQVNGSAELPVAAGSLAEGKFVGLLNGYDNGETLTFDESCTSGTNTKVSDYISSYTAANQSCFLTAPEARYDQYLGSENYYRGTVNYGNRRIVPKWDGKSTTVSLLPANEQLDGVAAGVVLYSPYDLAWLQDKSYGTDVYLRENLDMGGNDSESSPVFKPILSLKYLDGLKKDVNGFISFDDCYKILNLKVVKVHSNGNGAAFILTGSGSQVHQNLVFENSKIVSKHDVTITDIEDSNYGNAYAGTIVCKVTGAYTVRNVLVYKGNVSGVCKMGGLLGYCTGNLSAANCVVDYCTITNYDPQCINWYFQKEEVSTPIGNYIAYAKDSFYTDGEVGGLIGFITDSSPTITDCSVTNTTIDCTGEADKSVTVGVYSKDGFDENNLGSPLAKGTVTIAGRHVNEFIGDIRTQEAYNTITITNPYVAGNIYKRDCNNHLFADITTKTKIKQWTEGSSIFKKYYRTYDCINEKKNTSVVGCAYVVAVTVNVDILEMNKHVGDDKGNIIITNTSISSSQTTTTGTSTGDEIEWSGYLPETWKCTYNWTYKTIWNPAGQSTFTRYVGDDFSL